MKKHVHCLFHVLLFLVSWQISFATTDADYSGCCKPPYNKTITCDQLPHYFNPNDTEQLQQLFGKAENKCYYGLIVELPPTVNLSNCETGTITRRFQASNNYGGYDYCEQTITINGVHNYKIRFPADEQLACGGRSTPQPIIKEQSDCDYLVVSVKDQEFFNNNQQCGKIFRTYRVINWCEYDGYSLPKIIGRDEDCDGRAGDEAVWVIRRPSGTAFIDRNAFETDDNPRANERQNCSPTNPTGYWRTEYASGHWQYTQHIKIGDDEGPAIFVETPEPFCSYSNATCAGYAEIPFLVGDECTPNDITVKVFIDNQLIAEYNKGGSYTASGNYSIGAHLLEIHTKDGCGNPNVEKIPFSVIDCGSPTPICFNGITMTLMPVIPSMDVDDDGDTDDAALTIWAKDLIISQISDCSGVAGFSINRVGEEADPEKTSLIVTCEDIGRLDIEVYAWDNAFNPTRVQPDGTVGGPNFAFCRTYIRVQENNNRCVVDPGMGFIAGKVFTAGNHALENVNMMLIGNDSTWLYTSANGTYRFDSIPMQEDYRLIPSMEGSNIAEGINIIDLILLQRHILGIELIRSPYHLVAADVNRDGLVNEEDVFALRAVMLGTATNFPNNSSWRFVDAGYVFPVPSNPWHEMFPESMSISRMSNPENYGNFIAVKIGDINGSVIADRLGASSRSYETRDIRMTNTILPTNQQIEIPVRADFSQVQASQFALQFDPSLLELVDVKSGIIAAPYIRTLKSEGLILIAWDALTNQTTDGVLFTLVLNAKQTIELNQAVRLSTRRLQPIASANGNIVQISLAFDDQEKLEQPFALYQNTPNPFYDATVIRFQLPETARTVLRIFDINGKELWRQEGNFTKGTNQVTVTKKELINSGLVFYSLESNKYRAVKKMIILP